MPAPLNSPRVKMPPDLSAALMEHSPRLVVSRPTLLRVPDSPTGWVVVVPGTDEEVAEAEARQDQIRRPARAPAQ
jgi:hypothetical protein